MNKQEMIEKANGYAREGLGYSYSESVLEDIINAGIDGIADGTVIMDTGSEKLVRQGAFVESQSLSGNVLKRTELIGDAIDQILIMHAVNASKTSSGSGLR